MISLFVLVLIYPVFQGKPFASLLLSLLYTLIAAASALSVFRSRRLLVVVCSLGLPCVVLNWVARLADLGLVLNLMAAGLLVAFGFVLVAVLLQDILTTSTVTGNTLCRAVSGYMLIGISWAAMYQMLLLLDPGAILPLPSESSWSTCVYFSFITLTTLGFGDIAPVSPFARSLVIMEAVVGPMYLVILIARLVAAYRRKPVGAGS